ncbi:hypothetical protein [Microbacterium testaceum]|uniref:hypothetical protein n=1 Tax=Microbacterium testaceum TaxID=2033 RepID=UPI00128F664F|nr:hypothetical protein [Microbacterium testaceum]
MTADARTLSPNVIERMRPLWDEAYAALRTDIGTLEDLARAAQLAAAARDDPSSGTPTRIARGNCGKCGQPGHNRRACANA